MTALWMAAPWMTGYFADFEQVKKTGDKTPVEETGCLCIFLIFFPTQPLSSLTLP